MTDVDVQARTRELLEKLWHQHKASIFERVDGLVRLAEAAASAPLTEAQRAEGKSLAHKLAGSVGTFGHREASQWARELEALYEKPALDTSEIALLKSDIDKLLLALPPR